MSEEIQIRRAAQTRSKQFVDQYMLAVVAKRNKDFDGCINIMIKALTAIDSESLDYCGRFYLGNVYLHIGDAKNALEQFSKCLEVKPNDPSSLCKLGLCQIAINDIETAKKCFHSALEHNDVDNEYTRISRPYYELCILYRREGNLEKSFELIEQALIVDDTNVFYQCEKLLLGAQMENSFDEALLEIDEIIEINLKKEDVFAYPYYIKGICLQVKEAFQEAYECITKAFEVRVDYRRVREHELLINRGNYAYMIGKYDQAVEDLVRAKELVEKSGVGEFTCFDHNKLGSCYLELGEVEKALACFEKAVGMKPLCQFYENMGNCRMVWSQDNEDEFEKAALLYYKALCCDPEGFSAFENMGVISEFFMDSMRGENALMHLCRTIDPAPTIEQILFFSKEMDMDPEGKNEYDRNLLMYIIANPHGISLEVMVKLIEETEIDVHEVDQKERWNLVHHAVSNPCVDLEIMKFLAGHLEEYEFKEPDNLDRSILHLHCANKKSKLEILKYIVEDLEMPVDDQPDLDGKNGLHYLCENDPENFECVLYLVKKGAKLDEEDRFGKKSLDYLSEEMREKVMTEKDK